MFDVLFKIHEFTLLTFYLRNFFRADKKYISKNIETSAHYKDVDFFTLE